MFFQEWWQGIIFGVVTSVGMLSVAYVLSSMWKKYEDDRKAGGNGCDANSHH
ncbi:MAG: hypothetical protein ACOY31_09935 [Bacillota bacterium]